MATLTIRPYLTKSDCRALAVVESGTSVTTLFADIADLVKLNNPIGQLDEDTLVDDLQRFFEAPDVDRARNLGVWRDTNGRLIGFGQFLMSQQNDEIECYLYFDVHPSWRGDALETEILQWSEERLREVGKEQSVQVKLRTRCGDDKIVRRRLLERQNFTIERSFLTMVCSLKPPLSLCPLPNGFKLQRLSGDRRDRIPLGNLKAWVDLFNESFIDHWDHHDLTVETVRHWLKNPHYKPELNWVAVAPDGTFAAFCVGYINEKENARSGGNEGWIQLLGTRRGFRKLGLGRSLLLAQMRQLKAMGIEQVKLGVDAQSLTSATRLYQSVGFQPINTWLSYVKEIQ